MNSYEHALKSALREDPDILQVSTLDTAENISTALMAAETGKLIFSSMYTSGAADTIESLVDLFPEHKQAAARNRLASALRAVISRQLVTCKDGSERAAAYEILLVDNSVRSVIRGGETEHLEEIMRAGGSKGMITMDQSLTSLYKAGKIDRQTAVTAARDQESMEELLK